MIDSMGLPIASAGGGVTKPQTEASSGNGDFLRRLADGLGKLTGEPVTAEDVEAWLAGETPADFPADAELADALGSLLPADAQNWSEADAGELDDAGIDVAGLLAGLAASAAELRGGSPGAGADVVASRLGVGGKAARALLDGFKDESAAQTGEGFQQLVQTAASAQRVETPPATTRVGIPTLQIDTPVSQPGFGQAVGERVQWMVGNDLQQARIQLNPQHLGPLEVSLSLKDDHASVNFQAHNAATREALNAEAPRLRQMLADQGFNSVDVNVSENPYGGEERGHQTGGNPGWRGFGDGSEETGSEVPIQTSLGRGLVDHYV